MELCVNWCYELTRSGWAHSPCCSTRHPSRSSAHALDWVPLETASPRRCSGNQPEDGRIPAEEEERLYQPSVCDGQPSGCAEP